MWYAEAVLSQNLGDGVSNEIDVRGKDADEVIQPAKEFDNVEQELDYVKYLLRDMVEQNCGALNDQGRTVPNEYFSGFISCHAASMRYLCSVGLMKMINDGYGRAVYCADLNSSGE